MITFIVVTWNNEELVKDFFESLDKYTKIDYKVIVVDNNSQDKTLEELKKYKNEKITIVSNKENVGFAKANNIALKLVDTKYICYINPDIIFVEDIIEELIDFLEKNSNIGIIGPKLLNKDLTLQRSYYDFEHGFKLIKSQLNLLEKVFSVNKPIKSKTIDWIIGAVMVLRTEDAKHIDGFSEDYFMYIEDMDICKKMKKQLNKSTYYDNNVSIIHLGGQSERKNNNYRKDEIILKNIILFNKKFYSNTKLTIIELKICYWIKLKFSELRYFFNKNDNNKIILEKMQNSLDFLKKQNY